MADTPDYGSAIASVETGGQADPYNTLGPATASGDQAHGKYQVMGANIGPWSKEILGQELTPQQFLASPAAQDAIFQGKFGQYVDKYGPERAAQAWFGGPGSVGKLDRTDSLGTTVGGYGQKFMAALGKQQPPQAPAPAAAPTSTPAYQWTPPPLGAAAPAAQPQASQGPLGAAMTPQAPPQTPPPPPLQFAQRRPPNLTQLAALLAHAPPSVRGLISRG